MNEDEPSGIMSLGYVASHRGEHVSVNKDKVNNEVIFTCYSKFFQSGFGALQFIPVPPLSDTYPLVVTCDVYLSILSEFLFASSVMRDMGNAIPTRRKQES